MATRRAARVRPPDDLDAIDVSLVHADDGFLDALGAAEPDPDGLFADDGLATLLLSWQQDVASEPISRLAESTLAAAAVRAARARQQRQPRLQAALAKTAAALTIMLGSVGLAARHAEPGDKLWGITRVLYTEHARSVEAAAAVRTDLREAQEALANGKVVEAKSMLEEAMHSLPAVANEEGKDHLLAQHAALQKQLPDEPTVGTSTPPNNCTTLPTR